MFNFLRRGKKLSNVTARNLVNTYFNGHIKPEKTKALDLALKLISLGKIINDSATIKFVNENTWPHAEGETVVIPTYFTLPEFWETTFKINPQDSSLYSVVGAIGTMVHEINHTIYSFTNNLEADLRGASKNQSDSYIAFAAKVFNLVEDLYIDEMSRFSHKTKRVSAFTDELRAVTNNLDVEYIRKIEQPYMQKFSALLSLLDINVLEDSHKPLYEFVDKEIIEFLLLTNEIDSMHDRMLHAFALTDMLLDDVSQEELDEDYNQQSQEIEIEIEFGDGDDEDGDGSSGNGESENSDNDGEKDGKSSGGGKKKIKIKIGGGAGKDFKPDLTEEEESKLKEFLDNNKQTLDDLVDAIREKVRELSNQEFNNINEYKQVPPPVPQLAGAVEYGGTVNIGKTNRQYTNFYINKEWNNFAKHISNSRAFKSKNPGLSYNGYDFDVPSYANSLSGEKKVFVDALTTRVKAAPQVIIRVDGSGSTLYEDEKRNNKSYRQLALEAAAGMMRSMYLARIPFFCFMDTTSSGLLVTKLGSNLLPSNYDLGSKKIINITDFEKRCMYMNDTPASSNIDGYAIEYGSMFAQDHNREKVMISISDGAPSGSRNRLSPEKYLMKVIETLRKQRWQVYSVSVVEQVVHENNKLYGSEFNFDASKDINAALINLGKRILESD